MITKAIVINEDNISEARYLIANKLHNDGLSQSKISSLLNITQPMVSKYIMQKNKKYSIDALKDINYKKFNFSFVITEEKIPIGSYFISTKEHILTNQKSEIVKNITSAITILQDKDLSKIVPNVKMNLAMAIKRDMNREDIASIPGGMLIVNNYLLGYNEPEFGISRHLSQILLLANKFNKEILAIMNIKFTKIILSSLRSAKIRYDFLDDNYRIKQNKHEFSALIHEGSFGIEPCCYILGSSAMDVVEKCCKLLR